MEKKGKNEQEKTTTLLLYLHPSPTSSLHAAAASSSPSPSLPLLHATRRVSVQPLYTMHFLRFPCAARVWSRPSTPWLRSIVLACRMRPLQMLFPVLDRAGCSSLDDCTIERVSGRETVEIACLGRPQGTGGLGGSSGGKCLER